MPLIGAFGERSSFYPTCILQQHLHPTPHSSGIRPDSERDEKIQLKTPFSHLERPSGRGQGREVWIGAKGVIPENKQRKPSRSQVLELESNPGEGTRRELRHGGKSESRREGDPGICSGLGVGSSCLVSGACESPPPQRRALSSWLSYLGHPAARCRSLGRVSRSPALDSSGSMSRAGGLL